MNINNERQAIIRRFLQGRMCEAEEQSFLIKMKEDEALREVATSEALLCRTFLTEQRDNAKIMEKLKKVTSCSLLFDGIRDNDINNQ